jgi:hypothetical protein
LVWTGGVGSTLNAGWYFEGSNGNGALDWSGIYLYFVDSNTGKLFYNPISNMPEDSEWFATVDVVGGANVASLSAADFVLI